MSEDEKKDRLARLNALRISQDYAPGVREVQTPPRVRRPGKLEFVRVAPPDPAAGPWCIFTPENSEGRPAQPYLLSPTIASLAGDVGKLVELHAAVTRTGESFLWPVPVPIGDQALAWTTSHREAANLARSNWVRMVASMPLGAYRIFVAEADLGEPRFSTRSLVELIDEAFGDRIIDAQTHPLIQELLGRSA